MSTGKNTGTHEVRPAPRRQVPELLDVLRQIPVLRDAVRQGVVVLEQRRPNRKVPDRVPPRRRDRRRPSGLVEEPRRACDDVRGCEREGVVHQGGELRPALGGGEELARDEARAELDLGADSLPRASGTVSAEGEARDVQLARRLRIW